MLSYRLTGLVFLFQPVFVDRGAGLNGSTYWWFATSVVQVLDTSLAELEQQQRVEYALDFDLACMDDPTDIRCGGDCAQLVQVGESRMYDAGWT